METNDKKDLNITTEDLLQTPERGSPTSSSDDVYYAPQPPPKALVDASNYITLTDKDNIPLTVDELTVAVEQCKDLVLESVDRSEERKWLVRRLIELRYLLQEAIYNETEVNNDGKEQMATKVFLGHHFQLHASSEYILSLRQLQNSILTILHCERCPKSNLFLDRKWYQCSDCGYKCHIKCLKDTKRLCPHLTVSEKPHFEQRICPEIGLDMQKYSCAECETFICYSYSTGHTIQCFVPSFMTESSEPRRCDYTGLYYCTACHWNNKTVIPARVIHNWDFEPRFVSRCSYQLLWISRHRPLIKINPQLMGFVNQLGQMKKIREDLIVMKQYLVQCKDALEKQLPWQLIKSKQYLLKDSEHYSIQDLIDINDGTMVTEMKEIRGVIEKHIKKDCKVCSGQGYHCELCSFKESEVLFPFDNIAKTCPKCRWVYHKSCWLAKQNCPRCVRLEQRKSKTNEDFNDSELENM